MTFTKRTLGRIAGPAAFLLVWFFFSPEELNPAARAVLASTVWIAIWWITEAIPVEVTGLLPIILFPLTGAMNLGETTAAYGHKFIFLFVGGFILAIAIEKWQLHKRIALSIISLVGTSMVKIVLGFMVSTAFLSMWISNTATTVMMLPIGLAIIAQLGVKDVSESKFGTVLMLAIAYSASIGGIATLIGTPPNLVLAGVVEKTYGVEISFVQWLSIGLPISVLLLAICWYYLTRIAYPLKSQRLPGGKEAIQAQLAALGKMSFEEKMVLMVFVATALAWITRSFLLQPLVPGIDDTVIAITAGVSLFLLPSSERGRSILEWHEAVKLPWGVLLLFGGGIALAAGFESSGLAAWIGDQFTMLQGISILLLILILAAVVNFLTEITSNLATTAVLLPILIPLAAIIDVHPYLLLVVATVSASCAFMLPVATPPNALVFGSGHIRMAQMVRTGVWLNLLSIVLVVLLIYFLLPVIWGIEVKSFPEAFLRISE